MFDLDGTLADTISDIACAANHAMTSLGKDELELDRYRYLAGQGLYLFVREATRLPVGMDFTRAATVFTMIFVMCMASAGLAMRRLVDADPAEIF